MSFFLKKTQDSFHEIFSDRTPLPTEYDYDYKDNTAHCFVTQRRLQVKLNHVRAGWHVVQDAVTILSLFFRTPIGVCVWGVFGFFSPLLSLFPFKGAWPTLPLRASDHTAQPRDLSNTAGTSPASPSHSYPLRFPRSASSPDPSRKLWYRGVEPWGGGWGRAFPFLSASKTQGPSFFLLPRFASSQNCFLSAKRKESLPSLSFIVYASHAT